MMDFHEMRVPCQIDVEREIHHRFTEELLFTVEESARSGSDIHVELTLPDSVSNKKEDEIISELVDRMDEYHRSLGGSGLVISQKTYPDERIDD